MSKYKDRYGHTIKLGDIVLQLISLNMERHSAPYSVMVIKKKKNRLIIDGVWGWGYLSTQDPQHLCVLTLETDMRKIHCDFIDMQHNIHDSFRTHLSFYYKYCPHKAYEDLERIAGIMGFKRYDIREGTIEKVIASIDLFFSDKEIDKQQLEIAIKILKVFEQSVSDLASLDNILYKIRSKKKIEKE